MFGSDRTPVAMTILRDMDGELAALEAKLAKARHLKQGMMQELLTGRTRLVSEPAMQPIAVGDIFRV